MTVGEGSRANHRRHRDTLDFIHVCFHHQQTFYRDRKTTAVAVPDVATDTKLPLKMNQFKGSVHSGQNPRRKQVKSSGASGLWETRNPPED